VEKIFLLKRELGGTDKRSESFGQEKCDVFFILGCDAA
jgi:hypothetical protein